MSKSVGQDTSFTLKYKLISQDTQDTISHADLNEALSSMLKITRENIQKQQSPLKNY